MEFKNITKTTTTREIHTKPLQNSEMVLFQDIITEEISVNGGETLNQVTQKEGISKLGIIEEYAKTLCKIPNCIPHEQMYGKAGSFAVISKKDFDLMKKAKIHITQAVRDLPDDIYENHDDYVIVLWNVGSYRIAGMDGRFISVPVNFGYTDGNITNGYYDLQLLLKVLKEDEHVLDRDSLKIEAIPYYNRTSEETQCISFNYLLSDDEYNDLYCKSNIDLRTKIMKNPKFDSCRC